MRPAREKSRWVKVLPWYYTDKIQRSRQRSIQDALAAEDRAERIDNGGPKSPERG